MKPPRRLEMPPGRDLDVNFSDFSEIFALLLASVLDAFLDHCSRAAFSDFSIVFWVRCSLLSAIVLVLIFICFQRGDP